ncbi:MAG TPA: SGNH/GDSL hydrolase family protein [Solirubrobacterales bacterium]|nr:SGNH/GDSL hydrolase family protein [Solirubrobacterales bacterium]
MGLRSPRQVRAALAAVAVTIAGCSGGGDGETTPLSDHLIVSLGDSVASGEGNPDRPARVGRPAEWTSRRCHRSGRSGPALAAREVAGDDLGRVVLLGCSGATIQTGLLRPYAGIEPSADDSLERAQVRALADLAGENSIDAVLIDIGANDVGFARIVQFCVLSVGPCWKNRFDPRPGEPGPRVVLEQQVPREIEELGRDYARLAGALNEIVPASRVIVVEYFDPTGTTAGRGCTMFLGGVTPAESLWAREHILFPLNRQIRESADRFGWRVVDGVDERFAEHGICAPERWVVTAGESINDQGIPLFGSLLDRQTRRELLASYKGTLHPNPEGHRQIAELIRPVLEAVVDGPSG